MAQTAVLRDPRKPSPGQELPKRAWRAPMGPPQVTLLQRPATCSAVEVEGGKGVLG